MAFDRTLVGHGVHHGHRRQGQMVHGYMHILGGRRCSPRRVGAWAGAPDIRQCLGGGRRDTATASDEEGADAE